MPCSPRTSRPRGTRSERAGRGDPRRGPAQALRRRDGARRDRPRGAVPDGLRPARPERRRQDDDDPRPLDDPRTGRRPCRGARPRRRPRREDRPAEHRPRRPVRGRRRQPDGPREPAADRQARPPAPARGRRPRGTASRALRADRRGRPSRADILGRHAPSHRPRRGAREPSAGALPRRADDRARPAQPQRGVGDDRGPRRRRHDGRPHDAVPRGGRPARRARRRDRRWPRDRERYARRAEDAPRQHRHRDRARGRRDRQPGARGSRRGRRQGVAGARRDDRAADEPRRRLPRAHRASRRAGGGGMTDLAPTLRVEPVRRLVPQGLSDTLAIAWRGLITYRRVPQLLVFSTIQPVVFVLMFRYVFGGAIRVPGVDYVDYLMPGVFVQTSVFGAIATAIGLASDVQSGLLERFLSLPMARSAVLTGRTLADVGRNVFVIVLMAAVGFAVGFHLHTNWGKFVVAMLLILLFGYTLSWVFATVGLLLKNPEAAQAAAFPIMAPLVFASSAFVPVNSMPGWLQPFALHQPVSVTASAARALTLGTDATSDLVQALAWIAGILLVFVPLSVWRYRRAV